MPWCYSDCYPLAGDRCYHIALECVQDIILKYSKRIFSFAILVLCFLILGSHSMLHGNQVFFSILIFLFQNLLFWSFFQGNIKTVFRRPFWLQLYSLYSCWLLLIYAPVQRALQRNLAQLSILWIFQTKPLRSFFC